MKVLRLKIYQPSAHYRIPFTSARRHTYPIPPYSTVIGLICNVLGIENQENENFKKLKKGLSLAIYGKYKFLNREYIWLRNLNEKDHERRFGCSDRRIIDQLPEHPGGQIPVRVDVLEEVKLLIYIKYNDEKFLQEIKDAFENPRKRNSPIHLGRAEDWVIFEEINMIELNREKTPLYGRLKDYDFTWLVDPERGKKFLDNGFYPGDYKYFFNKIQGSYHLITSFYEVVEGIRNFEHVPVKLFEGGSFPLHFGKPFEFVMDGHIPLFFAKLSEGGKNG